MLQFKHDLLEYVLSLEHAVNVKLEVSKLKSLQLASTRNTLMLLYIDWVTLKPDSDVATRLVHYINPANCEIFSCYYQTGAHCRNLHAHTLLHRVPMLPGRTKSERSGHDQLHYYAHPCAKWLSKWLFILCGKYTTSQQVSVPTIKGIILLPWYLFHIWQYLILWNTAAVTYPRLG